MTLTQAMAACAQARNANPYLGHWRCTTPDARIKLKRLYGTAPPFPEAPTFERRGP